MKPLLNRLLLVTSFLFCALLSFAQGPSAFETTMRSNGRIYVVIAVIVTIFLGIIIYLVRLEKKIKKLEKGQ